MHGKNHTEKPIRICWRDPHKQCELSKCCYDASCNAVFKYWKFANSEEWHQALLKAISETIGKDVKELLDPLDNFCVEWRKQNWDVAKPFFLESLIIIAREKLLGVKTKPKSRLTKKFLEKAKACNLCKAVGIITITVGRKEIPLCQKHWCELTDKNLNYGENTK